MRYDVVVIGAGVGGYPAASYLADKGFKVAVVEEHLIGGECTNYGCVPSKALYHIAESIKAIEKIHGNVSARWSDIIDWSYSIVKEAREGIEYLLKERDIAIYHGRGVFKNNREIIVKGPEDHVLEADHVLIATGTDPADIPVARFDGHGVISNREVFNLRDKPDSILVIGGGVIGVEIANIFSSLGIEVAIVELMDHILPFTDKDIALAVRNHLASRGVKVYEKTTVVELSRLENGYRVVLSNNTGLTVEKVLVAVGRKPRTLGIGLENICVELDQKGFIRVGDSMRACGNIYASGDVVGGPLLAHKALLESIIAARSISKTGSFSIDYKLIPITIFTGLEVASIGYTEKELSSMGVRYIKYRLPIYYLSAVKIKSGRNAFIKILLDESSRKPLGIHVVSPNASEIISSFLPYIMNKMLIEEAYRMPYPHLTVSESLREIAEFILGEPIHFLRK